jgi:hypothetical protein
LDEWRTGTAILKYAHLGNSWGNMRMAVEIIKELWEIKDAIASEYGCDVRALVAHLGAKKHAEDERVIDLRSLKQTAEQRIQQHPNYVV